MKKIFKRGISMIILTAAMFGYIPSIAGAEVIKVDYDNYKSYPQSFKFVDLKNVVNRGFADDTPGDGVGGWSDQGPENDMSCFKSRGIVNFAGVDFDIIEPNMNNGKSAIMLRGQNDNSVPDEIEIPVDDKCAGIYFLHTSPWLSADEDVGSYTLVFEDGSEHKIDIQGSHQVYNWWGTAKSEEAIIAWTGNNDLSLVSLGLFPAANPYPDKKITKIIARTIGKGPYLGIVGITLTDSGPYLPVVKEENIGNPDTTEWYVYAPCDEPAEIAGTPLDMSYMLDAPAGKHGAIRINGEELVFEDGTPLNFWGITVVSRAMFPNYDEAEKIADRIAQLGFNAVRFHAPHFATDTKGGIDLLGSSTRRSDGVSELYMDRLCYFMAELGKRGIYFGMDLITSGLTWKNNNYQDDGKLDHSTRGPNFFDEETIKLQNKMAENYLSYKNPYTGTTIGTDPALAFVSLYNETSIFMVKNFDSWEYYYPKMKKLYNDWLCQKYPTRNDLEAAWTERESEFPGLLDPEDQTEGTVELYQATQRKKCNNRRFEDNMEFLADMQLTNMKERFAEIRKWAPNALLQGSTCYTSGTDDRGNIYSQAKGGDYYSMQTYFYLAVGNGEQMIKGTKISKPESAFTSSKLQFMSFFANAKIFNKPYFLTEWDNGMPNPFRSEFTLLMGAYAQFQNWNPFLFTWDYRCNYNYRKNIPESEKYLHSQHSLGDRPEMLYSLPVVALMVHRKDVEKAQEGYFSTRYRGKEVFSRAKQSIGGDIAYAWCGKSGGMMIDDISYDPDYNSNRILKLKRYGDETGKYISYTGEMMFDTNTLTYKLNTDRTQAAAGYINHMELEDVIFDIKNKFSTVYLTSLSKENKNIHDSEKLLLTLVGDVRMTGQVMTEDGSEFISGGGAPMIMEPIKGTITIKSKNDYDVWALGFNGKRKFKLNCKKTAEGYTAFETKATDETMNYEIVRTKEAAYNPKPEKITYIDETIFNDLFTDLGAWEKDKDKIERIYMQDYIGMTAPGKFSPEQSITRGAAVELIANLFGFVSEENPGFADILETNAYYKSICGAAKFGVITGDENGNFRPKEAISRQDFILMLKKALDKSAIKRTEKVNAAAYSDASEYAKQAIDEMTELGYVMPGLCMTEPMPRGDACIMIYDVIWE